jgi:hypothetical protein
MTRQKTLVLPAVPSTTARVHEQMNCGNHELMALCVHEFMKKAGTA